MLFCPYIKYIHIDESTGYKKFPSDDGRDAVKEKTITTSFGQCVLNECPFYSKDKKCRRVESEVKNGKI